MSEGGLLEAGNIRVVSSHSLYLPETAHSGAISESIVRARAQSLGTHL
jgi:hypothetical protein